MNESPTFFAHIRELIAHNELDAALQQLRDVFEHTPHWSKIIFQTARFQGIQRQIALGTVSHADATLTQNQIRAGLLDLVDEIEAINVGRVPNPYDVKTDVNALRAEPEQAISIVNSKNVVANSTVTAGRDANFGYTIITNIYNSDERKAPEALLTTAGAHVPQGFIGRERELAEIRQRLTAGQNTLALVNAEGGMGKTTLAAAYWQRFHTTYKHCAWLFCESGILYSMRSQLPEPLGLREEMDAVADQPEVQMQWIAARMANLPKDCLLVLDNANEADYIRDFERYAAGLGWHVLITSRCSKVLTDREAEYPITSLPPEEARRLFRQYHDEAPNPDFPALLDRFLNAVGHNTLCIELFSKHLREGAGWGLSLAQLLASLEQNGLRLGAEDSFEVRTHWATTAGHHAATTDQVIEALYRLDALAPEARDLLTQCCLLPAESHPSAVWTALLAPDDPRGLKRGLDALVQKGWLSADTAHYRVSPVVQRIALVQQKEQLWALGNPMVTRLHAIFEHEGYNPVNIQTAGPFADLVFGIVDNLGVANDDIAMLFDRLWVYFTATGNLSKAMDAASRLQEVCEKYGDKNNLAISYEKLGSTHTALGNLPTALTFFEQYNQLEAALYEAYPQNVSFKNSLAISYQFLGSTYTALGNLTTALTFFEKDIELSKEMHEAYPQNVDFKNGLAISYFKLGETHTALGNLPTALTFFEQCNQLEAVLYEAYPQNVNFKKGLATSYEKLGETHTALGNLLTALTFFEKDIELSKELHEAYTQNVGFKNGLAISYQHLGITHTALGNLTTALTFFEQYNQLSKELYETYPENVSFKNSLAISYQYLGKTYTALGNLPTALTFFEQYNQLEKELYEAYPQNVSFKNSLAISYEKLGSTYTALGNLPTALTFFEQYNQLEKELYEAYPQNVSFKNGLAISCQYLGKTYTALGNLTTALTFFQELNQLETALHESYPQNVAFKNGLAISCQYLGMTHTALGNLPTALTFFEQYNQLSKELHESYLQNVDFKHGLAISCQYLGMTHTALGNLPTALTFFEQYNQLSKELYEAYPQNVDFKNGLAISYLFLGQFQRDQLNNPESARPYFQKGYNLYAELVRDFPDYQAFQGNYEWVKEALGME
jgi:tetratricopeptide (TPR) repeat protein